MDTNSNGARVTTKRKETFQCIHCNELFTANKNLRRHTKKFHVGEELPVVRMGRTPKTDMSTHNTPKPQKSSGSRFTEFHCALCNKDFTASKNLKRHMSRSHVNSGVTGMKQNECKRPYNASAHQIRRLSNVVMEFDSFTEFEEWKKQEEDAVVARFVKVRGDLKKRNGTIIKAFYCHRSGHYIPLLHQRKRYVKIQGSCKTGVVCPAAMIAKILVTGQVQLSYCAQHCGHQLEVAHIGLRQEDRAEIARKLAAGIPFQDVLDTWYVNSSNSNINRKSLLTNKDLANICVEFGLNTKEMLHTNDAESVAAWIELTKQDPASRDLVRYVKFQGETGAFNLRVDDFILVMASDAQLVAARTSCAQNCQVCLDSTHGLNSYDFQLTTVMCIDEHGEGLPVAFCYSSKVDSVTMTAFLTVFKGSLGIPLENVILMTDDTEVYSNAWTAVMGQPNHRLLCAWHVDRAWRKNLTKITGDASLKKIVYQTMRALLEISDKEEFHRKLEQFLSMAKEDNKTLNFAAYFEREYSTRPALWAYSYRIGLKVHHNMHLEAMHRVLKHVHLQGRKVRRLDKSIHALMRFQRAKMSDRLVKIYRGKWNRHIGGIRKRHELSKTLPVDICSCVTENLVYTVIGNNKLVYTVRQSVPVMHDFSTCALICSECKICTHSFSCSCLDSGLRHTICKHIHHVVQTFQPIIGTARTECTALPANFTEEQAITTEHEYDSHIGSEVEVLGHEAAPHITESQAIFNSLGRQNSDGDVERLLALCDTTYSFLRSAMQQNLQLAELTYSNLSRLKALHAAMMNKPQEAEQARLPKIQNLEPANKKITTQRSFRSLCRSKKRSTPVSVCKPTDKETEFLLKSLDGNVPIVSTQPSVEHDYAYDTQCQVINFEHSYTSRR